MLLPSQQQCHALWDQYALPENIRRHTEQVTLVADKVARFIKDQGVEVDLELTNRGGLLHDLGKWPSITQPEARHHGEIGAGFIVENGFDTRLARVVKNHATHLFSFDLPIEDQIVNYADKRVQHDKIVSLDERIIDLKSRYPDHVALTAKMAPMFYEFERKFGLSKLANFKGQMSIED